MTKLTWIKKLEFIVQPLQIMPICENRNAKITLIPKVNAFEKSIETGKIKGSAREFYIQTCQLRNWRKNYSKIKQLAEQSLSKLILHPGKKVESPALEQQSLAWIMEQRKVELSVSTTNIIDKAASICPDFKEGNEKKRLH